MASFYFAQNKLLLTVYNGFGLILAVSIRQAALSFLKLSIQCIGGIIHRRSATFICLMFPLTKPNRQSSRRSMKRRGNHRFGRVDGFHEVGHFKSFLPLSLLSF